MNEWERFIRAGGFDDREYYMQTSRLKVPGGWIVRERLDSPICDNGSVGVSVSICFVPDVHHTWNIDHANK